jgi:hypothetical protein
VLGDDQVRKEERERSPADLNRDIQLDRTSGKV